MDTSQLPHMITFDNAFATILADAHSEYSTFQRGRKLPCFYFFSGPQIGYFYFSSGRKLVHSFFEMGRKLGSSGRKLETATNYRIREFIPK